MTLSWHVVQAPFTSPWSTVETPTHRVVTWQDSQRSLVTKWPAGLPAALTSLWHSAQRALTPVCDIETGIQAAVL